MYPTGLVSQPSAYGRVPTSTKPATVPSSRSTRKASASRCGRARKSRIPFASSSAESSGNNAQLRRSHSFQSPSRYARVFTTRVVTASLRTPRSRDDSNMCAEAQTHGTRQLDALRRRLQATAALIAREHHHRPRPLVGREQPPPGGIQGEIARPVAAGGYVLLERERAGPVRDGKDS